MPVIGAPLPEPDRQTSPTTTDDRSSSVGSRIARPDGLAKAAGTARYVDDLVFPRMLHGRTVRSTIAKGTVRAVRPRVGAAEGFVVVDHRDIPGVNVVTLIEDDQPCLVETEVRHIAEPILLLAHEDREALNAAIVDIEYDEQAPLLDPAHSDVVQKRLVVARGDLDAGFADADVIIEGDYTTGHQEQLYIETNGVIAVPEPGGGISLYGSIQCPFYVRRALAVLLDLPPERVRVVQTETGGGFGGKEEYPSMLAGHAALLALEAGRPVKMIYDRTEDMLATTKRHPFRVRHRTGVKRDGTLTAVDIDILCDGGAYVTLTPVVLSRGVLHSVGPYRCDNVRVVGRAVMTNTPPNGAFRGFGAPQTQFAAEVHMERIAEELGVDPVELRERNALRPGDVTITGGRIGADGSALEVLREAVRRSDYHAKRAAYRGTGRGIGLSLFFHGSGFTGDGEKKLASEAALEVTAEGVRVLAGTCDIGQGTRTIHAQIVADVLGIPFEQVTVVDPDTSRVPDSGPTVASRTCMVVGGILQRCAHELRERLDGLSPREYHERHGSLVVSKHYEAPPGLSFDEVNYVGDAYGTYAWACDVAEVELDPDTYQVRPLRITAVQEIGKAIHPVLAGGQIEGGTAQGVGYGLIEEVVMRGGAMANASLTNYLIPTTLDTPRIDVTILEHAYEHGPFGAKGVGELPIDGPAPALLNALRHLGVDLRALPATPERVMEAMCD
ncbi:MAG TPA: xanthine dehydrogenase family protein molybdopterin-binding subunit [Longimicrobiales bacterium]|nr:xanthine dehydrogenase family protein molybdopterin-binding subunit [Longimicrobiales bacterium]